ncbi:MAG: CHASE2 domain-containing protein, partial [Usitatibacter sp.]
MRTFKDKTRLAMSVAALLVAVAAIDGARALGWLERSELAVHDALLELRADPQPSPDVVVVLESEGDLQRFGHPLSDALLAQAIDLLATHGAAAIGVDKYRDKPVAPGEADLDRVLKANADVIWVTTFGDGPDGGVLPPAALRGTERAACGDIIGDADGRVRRAILYLEEGPRKCRSLAFSVASAYLRAKGESLRLDGARADVVVRAGAAPIA